MFCNGLLNGLINKFQQNGLKADGFIQSTLSLESESDINKKIVSFKNVSGCLFDNSNFGWWDLSTVQSVPSLYDCQLQCQNTASK